MATLKITRDSGYADLVRAYDVILDGKKIGELRNGESKEFSVTPGQHALAAKIDWCGSKTLQFHARDSNTVSFNIRSNLRGLMIFLVLWYVLFDRDSYLLIEKTAD